MPRLSALVSLFLLALSQSPVRASPCIAFDVDFNLFAFGLNSKDWNIGTQDVWTSGMSAFRFSSAIEQPSNFHLSI